MEDEKKNHDSTGKPRCETKHNQHRRSYWHDYRQKGLYMITMAEEDTVLITPGISKGESLVASDALDAHLPLILVQKEPIGEYWKPSQRRFYACAAGHLLILAPWVIDGATDYSRFHQLNDFVREICDATEMRILNYSALNHE